MRRLSKGQRQEAFLALAGQMYGELEAWYEAHPEASFEEIETVARDQRRALMGEGLAILVNGRDSGYVSEGQRCPACGGVMDYKGEGFGKTIHGLEGDTRLERAYYVCPKCAGETLFPPG
jgi:hypothetical protein